MTALLARTRADLDADLVMVLSQAGQPIGSAGSMPGIDLTALASLAAANLAATDALAQVLREPSFSTLHHQGKGRGIHITDIGRGYSVVVVISRRLPAGMVRWKMQRAAVALKKVLLEGEAGERGTGPCAPSNDRSEGMRTITDEELDRLFGDPGPIRPAKVEVEP